MVDKVKHWPSWANYSARVDTGGYLFCDIDLVLVNAGEENEGWMPSLSFMKKNKIDKAACNFYTPKEALELVEIDPDTPWQESKQRRPE